MSTNIPISFYGPIIVGYTLCWGLMGALMVQAYTYFTKFTGDKKAIKALVTVVLLLEVLTAGCAFCSFLISGDVTVVGATAGYSSPAAGLATTLTHGFYCWRISSLRKSSLVPLLIMMVSLLQFASIIYFAFTTGLFPSNISVNSKSFQLSYTLDPWLVIWLGSTVCCDVAITVCMIHALHPSKSHFRSNKLILVKLTRFTIETGLVTAAAALLELALGVAFRTHIYHLAVFYAISKLYANCLLASLNFRLILRDQSDPSLTTIVWDGAHRSDGIRPLDGEARGEATGVQSGQPGSWAHRPERIVARVDTDVETVIDLNETCGRKTSREDETYEIGEGVNWGNQYYNQSRFKIQTYARG